MTPYELTVLIHHYTSLGCFEYSNTELYKNTVIRFVFDGLFIQCSNRDNGYAVTDLGKAWISVILKTPIPKLAYVDAEGKIV